MKNFGLYTYLSILVLLVASCKKNSTEFIPTSTITIIESDTTWDNDLSGKSNLSTNLLAPLSIEKIVAQLKAEPIIDTFAAERGDTIVIPDNVTVTIPPSICTYSSNNRPCTGKLEAQVLVLRKKGDFISHNLPTTASNRQLISGGVVSIRVQQNGQDVRLGAGKTVKVRYLMPEPDNLMQLFEGITDGRFNFNWIQLSPIGSPRPSVTTWIDSVQSRRGYEMVLDRFGLINCDKFYNDSTSFNNKLSVSLPDNFTNMNTSVYVVFKDLNSVLSLVGDSKTRAFVPIGRGLPMGKAVTILTISYLKEKFYFSKQDMMIQNTTGTVRMTPSVAEKETIKEMLQNL